MRALIFAVAVVWCAARPMKRETRTDFAFPVLRDPSVVTILRPSLPQVNALTMAANHAPLVKASPPVQVPVTVLKGSDSIVAHAPVEMAASPEPLLAPEPPMPSVGEPFVGGQFHTQDEAGQYTFGHWGGPNTRVETQDSLGRTSGSFAYINPDGDVEVRKYGASPATGFRVAASDLPSDTPKVAQSESLAFTISEPGITFKASNPVQDAVPFQVSAPDPVTTIIHTAKTAIPVQYVPTGSVAAEVHSVEATSAVQYTDLSPLTTVVQTVRLATPVKYVASAPVTTEVEVASPVEYAFSAPVTTEVEVAAPVQYAGPAPVVAPAPVVVAAAPEPLLAPDPPMPSVGEPFVGGQFHAQDEAGQYTFGHWGGPNTRVETRDSLGRTSGSFAYINPDGDVEVRKYGASPATGFRVAASDLPVDTPKLAQSDSLAFTISKPGIILKTSSSIQDAASSQASAPVPVATADVATEVKTVQVFTPVQYATPIQISAPEVGIKFQTATPVQYVDPAVEEANSVPSVASPAVAARVELATPEEFANLAVVATLEVAEPVKYAVPAPVVAPAPVVVAAVPEPLLAPDPPMPSVGEPFVGGQFHAQDEAGQYTFGHWGGPHTRVETRDSLGRTSGSFAYINPDRDVEVRKYGSSTATGFRVAASDLPSDMPKVAQSESLAFTISEPGITFKASNHVQDAVPFQVSAPDPVTTIIHTAKTAVPVQYVPTASVAAEVHSAEATSAVQYTDLSPLTTEVQTVRLATPVKYVASAPVTTEVEVASPVEYAFSAPVTTEVEVAAPVQYAGPAPVVAPAPVVVAAAPEPLLAPDPPMPSVGEPFVGGQFHAQDEAGQYTFGHWGGPNTRVETRDSLGRTSGSFAYINPDGDVEVRKYGASPATGFRVAASDLPMDTPKLAQSDSLAFTISKPGITLKTSSSIQDAASSQASAPVPVATADVATEVKTVQVFTPVQYATPIQISAPEVGIKFQTATPVQYVDPAVEEANSVDSVASPAVAARVELATPEEFANLAVVATLEVAEPVKYAVPAPVVAPAPVELAAAPEPLLAPDPPMPSVGELFVGGQFHAQDEAGQYSFGHWGGPNTRVETRDSLGRTSGSFAYINPDGDVEVRKYGASPATGFRVAASDLPSDMPKVAQSESLSFMISEPGITFKASNPVQDAVSFQVSALDPVTTIIHTAKTTIPVQYVPTASVAAEVHSVEATSAVQYTDLSPLTTEVQTVRLPTPVKYVASAPVTTEVEMASPVEYAFSAPVTTEVEVEAPVQYAGPASVVAPAPVVVAAAPEPLLAPDPPMPSVGEPFVGGQFHAQDEDGQYTFGHWGGPNTRVETRDSLGRTSGSFAYINPDGDVEVRKYGASPATGFKVAASDLPVDTPKLAQSDSLAFTISKPGITLKTSSSIQDAASSQASAPVPVATADVATEVKTVQVFTPVQYATPIQISAPEVGIKFQTATPVQYVDPAVKEANSVDSVASPAVAARVELATPEEFANLAVVATLEVAEPVKYAVPAPVVAPAPVVVAAAPEPLLAPDPPMPSVGEPFVGGQFHAQDEAGQYTFGHWGGPNTRMETRDSLGRTSGSFAYINPDGDVEVRKYGASPATGFRVAASDLPSDMPKVAQSESLAFTISEPGITFKASKPVQDAVPFQVSAPDPVTTLIHTAKTAIPVQYVPTASVAAEVHSVEATSAVQYTDLSPLTTEVQTVRLHTPVKYVASAPVTTEVEVASPVEYAFSAPVTTEVEVAAPVQYAGPAPVVAPAPVVVAAAPEPLLAPDPPMPSVGEPFVGGQFHAQDEAGQYTFGHWGGPNTRVETRDSLGRTSGSFAYINPDGDVEVRKYGASPATGFKVAASDLPVDTPKLDQSDSLAFTICKPGITLKTSSSIQDAASSQASAPVPVATADVATEVKTVQVFTPVQYATPIQISAPEVGIKFQTATPVQYVDPAVEEANSVDSAASPAVAARVELATPVESANLAVVAKVEVAAPVQYAVQAPVVAPAPVVVAAG